MLRKVNTLGGDFASVRWRLVTPVWAASCSCRDFLEPGHIFTNSFYFLFIDCYSVSENVALYSYLLGRNCSLINTNLHVLCSLQICMCLFVAAVVLPCGYLQLVVFGQHVGFHVIQLDFFLIEQNWCHKSPIQLRVYCFVSDCRGKSVGPRSDFQLFYCHTSLLLGLELSRPWQAEEEKNWVSVLSRDVPGNTFLWSSK